MKNILIAIAVLVLAGLAYYFLVMREEANEVMFEPPVLTEQHEAAQPPRQEMPAAEPLESQPPVTQPESPPLPALEDSDPVVVESAKALFGESALTQNLVAENVVSRIVASIDAMTGRQVSPNLLPMQPLSGELEVTEDTDPANLRTTPEGDPIREYELDPVNYQRYRTYVDLLESVKTDELLASYMQYRPLFQKAYAELGYPQGDFNSRLLEVIDHLLDAPEASGPIRLVKPEAYYLFADPQLEALTAGQKLMIRMGSSNAQRVKRKLADIRAALETVSPIN